MLLENMISIRKYVIRDAHLLKALPKTRPGPGPDPDPTKARPRPKIFSLFFCQKID